MEKIQSQPWTPPVQMQYRKCTNELHHVSSASKTTIIKYIQSYNHGAL